jgi:hypothetical protein
MAPHQYQLPTRHVLIVGEEDNGRVTINASDFDPEKHTPCDVDGNPLEEDGDENADTNGDGTVDEAEAKAAAEKKAAKEKAKAERKAKKKEQIPLRQ